jgi:hypothetical protein
MGLFNDNVGAGRTGWTYKYKGSELLPYAQKLYAEFRGKEAEARKRMADFMNDMNIAQSDRRVAETKNEIQSFGSLKEQCAVFKHEFARNPNQEYDLGLGDVTFFGLTGE